MNIVFWGLVTLVLVLIWFAASSIFRNVGSFIKDIFNDAKNEVQGDE